MPNHLHCQNCLQPKPLTHLDSYLCPDCLETAKQAVEFATREGQDPGAARRAALLDRAPRSMDNKSPSRHFERIDTSQYEARINAERGSLDDPRRHTA